MSNNVKDLKLRIRSVKSTQKITRAMKVVAAAKLKKSREKLEAALPYIEKMQEMVTNLSEASCFDSEPPELLTGREEENTHLIIVVTSDRGLCGAFNSSVVKATKRYIQAITNNGKEFKILCIGNKGYEGLKNDYAKYIINKMPASNKKETIYYSAEIVIKKVLASFLAYEFDKCVVLYNKFKNTMSQVTTVQQLIPIIQKENIIVKEKTTIKSNKLFEYEPNEKAILAQLLPKNIIIQLYHILLENSTSEQGARMTAMDNATTNAGEMIKSLTLLYNRTRQAAITKELIEIISGAEAL